MLGNPKPIESSCFPGPGPIGYSPENLSRFGSIQLSGLPQNEPMKSQIIKIRQKRTFFGFY
jgi:hypothetical protein